MNIRAIVFFAFATSISSLLGQVPTGPEISWQECYGGSAEEFYADATIDIDENILSVIVSYSFDYEYFGSWLILSDADFNEIWRKEIAADCIGSTVREIALLSNNTILVFGNTGGCSDSIGEADFGVFCYNLEGELVWERSYGSSQWDVSHTLLPTSDGGFLVGGSTRGFDGDLYMPAWNDLFYDDALIMKMDSMGEVEWVDIVGGTFPDLILSNFLEIAPDQYMVMIVSSSSDYDLSGSGMDDLKKYLIRIYDKDGDVLKENIISAEDNLIDKQCSLQLLSDGNVLLAGSGTSEAEINPTYPEHDGYEGALAIINEDLELIDLHLYGGTGNDYFWDIIPSSLGGYYCLGSSSSNDGDLPGNYGGLDNWILHFDEAYNLIWSKNLGSAGTDVFTNKAGQLIEKDNMLYVFNQVSAQAGIPTGNLTCGDPSTNKVDAWLVALDLTTVGIENEPQHTPIQLYPNPVTNTLTIQLIHQIPLPVTYTIANTTGKTIETGELINPITQLNTGNNAPGVYLFSLIIYDIAYSELFIKE